jgi:monofunctional biosynthetic peptidoglycan transglycosylase
MTVLVVLLLKYFNPPFSSIMLWDNLNEKYEFSWISIDKVPDTLIFCVLISEDKRFLRHNGFDFVSIKYSLSDWLKGKKIRGASTISQQTAKNLFLWKSRGIFGKLLEAYLTVFLENILTKKRIFELYINIIQMGNGIYGIKAGAQYYFNKEPTELTLSEILIIASIIPSPIKYALSRNSKYYLKKQEYIKKQLHEYQFSIF